MRALQQLIRQHAPRVNIGAVIGVHVASGLLGRHVGWRTDRHTHLCERRVGRLRSRRAQRLGDAEVGHHGRAAREQHILRLDVAVHDAARVRIGERLGHIAQNAERFDGGQCAVGDAGAQRLAGHERHGEPRQSIGGHAGGQHRHDMRLLQRRGELDLAREALGAQPCGQLRREHLHHHLASQRLVAREEHTGHAAAAKLALQQQGVGQGLL